MEMIYKDLMDKKQDHGDMLSRWCQSGRNHENNKDPILGNLLLVSV